MKYSNIIGTTVVTLTLGMVSPFVVADMHGDKEKKHDKMSEQHQDKAMDESAEANTVGERSETDMGIEARPGSDGITRAVPGAPDVGLEPATEPSN